MASAGNIILNLPTGGKGPYRVAPQGRVFYAQPPQTMQNIAGTLRLVQEAKKVADAVAPFLASEYRPPEQQIDIAQRRSEQAQKELEAAKLRQIQTAKGLVLPPVADPSVQKMLRANEMLQQAQTPEQLAEAQRLYAESQAESKDLQSAASDIAQARRAMMEARKEEIDPAAQRAAFERQSLAAAPPRLPTFDTLAQAEAAIAQAKATGNYQAIGPMLQGLQYSALRDVAPSNAMETMNPLIARRNAIQAMLQRLKLPAELTPQRAALQRSAQDIARSGVAARREATEQRRDATQQRRDAVAAADARQKEQIKAKKDAAKAAAEAAREYEKLKQEGRMALEGKRQKGRRRLEGAKAYYRKQELKLRNAKNPDQLEKVIRTSEGAMASEEKFISTYTDHPGQMPSKNPGEKQIDYNRRVAAWKSKSSRYKQALAKYASNRIVNARARYMREWMLKNPNKPVPADRLSGEIPSKYYAPELRGATPPTNKGGSGGTTTNAPPPPPAAAAETINILKGNQGQ